MKYIRTENGIYDTTKMSCQTLNAKNGLIMILSYQKQISENCIKVINYKDIIKQANTIEELCDEFVMVTKYDHFQIKKGSWLGDFFNPKYNYISYSNEIGPDSKEKIIGKFGAIWTKGEHDEPILKSVAKMKGILPNGEIDWELL